MDAENSPANLGGVIVRSRTRYKRNRPTHYAESTQTLPKIQQEQLRSGTRGAFGQNCGHESQGLNSSHAVPCIKGSPLAVSRGSTEDENQFSTVRKKPTIIPTPLTDHHPRKSTVHAPKEDQSTQPDLQRRYILSGPRTEQAATKNNHKRNHTARQDEELSDHIINKKLSLEFKASQEHQGRSIRQHLGFRDGGVEEPYGRSFMQPVQSPSIQPKRLQIKGQVCAKPVQTDDHPAGSNVSMLQKRSLTHKQKRPKAREDLKRTISAPMVVQPTESSIKPAFDAPVSAVNAGERKIWVQINDSVLSIPVMPSTTPLDVIHEASIQLSTPVDANGSILLESFKQLGLERPLRQYEHVRDVMNSWDSDSQNTLNIVPSSSGGIDDNLDLESAPQSQPGDTSVHIYHSNAPRTWDKRWITLRSDGQVVMTKRDGKETSNICHISDFDIYSPTIRQIAKKIKPPKKYCFAVKSQQKSAMFLNTENFVHFFAFCDRELAMVWYKAVQEWRSWYLVNVMGKGRKDTTVSGGPQRALDDFQSPKKTSKGKLFRDRESQPILTPTKYQSMSQPANVNRLPIRSHGPPPMSFPQKLTKDASGGVAIARNNAHHRPSIIQHQSVAQKQDPFAAHSLLGRTYTQRQNAVARESGGDSQDPGHVAHRLGNDSHGGGDGLRRSPSQRPKTKPLLDLTPKYQEPPQHQKKGRGFLPAHIPAGGLVEAATSPESLMNDPSKASEAELLRSRTEPNQYPPIRQTNGAPESPGSASSGRLLSSPQRHGQDSSKVGHGNKTGNRLAREPLLDTTTDAPWMKGSLLDRVNSGDSAPGHAIDRAKRHEINAPVGEGF